jgi:hypothetical protein
VELSQLNADYSSKTRRMKRYKHLWQRMDPIVNTAASSAAAAGPDVQPWQVPSLLQRAAMLETWAEERSVTLDISKLAVRSQNSRVPRSVRVSNLEAAASVVALDLHMPSAPTVVLKEEAKPM